MSKIESQHAFETPAALWRKTLAVLVAAAFMLAPAGLGFSPARVEAAPLPLPPAPAPTPAPNGCNLDPLHHKIKHVVYIQFDNVHLERDNPNVPSDLEQMPNLLNFLKGKGTLLTNSHTPLISHTSDDILTSLTGVYGDRHGGSVGNSFGFFPLPGTSTKPDLFDSTFTYWTDPVSLATPSTDPNPIMIAANGKNAPAPWVVYTRAGCNFGAVSIANMELENVSSDVATAFAGDPGVLADAQAEASSNFNKAVADFEGIAIHCATGDAVCSSGNTGVPDVLPDEPGGYSGFNALYGHKFVAPVISPGGPLQDLDGNLVTDNHTNQGFPGFGAISASQTLAYVASMLEHNVPVVYSYISDAHDNHATGSSGNPYAPAECKTNPESGALGPGNACYEAQLQAYNSAFGKFFARLAADGIDQTNTLFLITTEEQDHFAGGPATPADCDGVNVTCSYAKLGEVDVNTTALLNAIDPNLASTFFDLHFDMAPTFYISGNPAPNAPITREFERATGKLTAVSPITGNTDNLTVAMADPVGMKLLHMITADPQRTPSFVMFGNPDYYFQTYGTPTVVESPAFAWNHGGIQPEITTTWAGFVGPGIRGNVTDGHTFADETDYRPTMLALVGLQDDYQHEGRVLTEIMQPSAVPSGVSRNSADFLALAAALKRINAPLGPLSQDALKISTVALNGNDANDATYNFLTNEISTITTIRDNLAGRMLNLLEDAEFNGRAIRPGQALPLIIEADALQAYVHFLEAIVTR
ncbi:MAG TPA: hypothetical protein VMV61_00145 [Patescibacteria group bacterium]|nr:hypothetical protein [Patescibacteria group bacterium]